MAKQDEGPTGPGDGARTGRGTPAASRSAQIAGSPGSKADKGELQLEVDLLVSGAAEDTQFIHDVVELAEAGMGTVIVVLLVAVAAAALTLVINKAGDWIDEKVGWWIGGFIALIAGSAITLILVNAAKQAGKQIGGG